MERSRCPRGCWSGQLRKSRESHNGILSWNSRRLGRTLSEVCLTWSICCSRCTQHLWLSRAMRPTTLSPTHKNPLKAWRRRQNRFETTTGGRKRNLLRSTIFLERCSLLELEAGIERWESYVLRCENKLMDAGDQTRWSAGIGVQELEKLLMLKSNILRTFDDARLEIVTYVEVWLQNS